MVSTVKVWFDKEGDYLEVLFSDKPRYMRKTYNNTVMERVDKEGNLWLSCNYGDKENLFKQTG